MLAARVAVAGALLVAAFAAQEASAIGVIVRRPGAGEVFMNADGSPGPGRPAASSDAQSMDPPDVLFTQNTLPLEIVAATGTVSNFYIFQTVSSQNMNATFDVAGFGANQGASTVYSVSTAPAAVSFDTACAAVTTSERVVVTTTFFQVGARPVSFLASVDCGVPCDDAVSCGPKGSCTKDGCTCELGYRSRGDCRLEAVVEFPQVQYDEAGDAVSCPSLGADLSNGVTFRWNTTLMGGAQNGDYITYYDYVSIRDAAGTFLGSAGQYIYTGAYDDSDEETDWVLVGDENIGQVTIPLYYFEDNANGPWVFELFNGDTYAVMASMSFTSKGQWEAPCWTSCPRNCSGRGVCNTTSLECTCPPTWEAFGDCSARVIVPPNNVVCANAPVPVSWEVAPEVATRTDWVGFFIEDTRIFLSPWAYVSGTIGTPAPAPIPVGSLPDVIRIADPGWYEVAYFPNDLYIPSHTSFFDVLPLSDPRCLEPCTPGPNECSGHGSCNATSQMCTCDGFYFDQDCASGCPAYPKLVEDFDGLETPFREPDGTRYRFDQACQYLIVPNFTGVRSLEVTLTRPAIANVNWAATLEMIGGGDEMALYAFRDAAAIERARAIAVAETEMINVTEFMASGEISRVALFPEFTDVTRPYTVPGGAALLVLESDGADPAGVGFDLAWSSTACDPGEFVDDATGQCSDCQAGFFSDASSSFECEPCPPGFRTANPGSAFCASCAPGTFAPANGTVTCDECPPGSFASKVGSLACDLCPPGSFSGTQGRSGCDSCPVGTYAADNGTVACRSCPLNAVTDRFAATSSDSCVCAEGFMQVAGVSADDPENDFCVPCPEGATCAGLGAAPETQPGWWAQVGDDGSVAFLRCGDVTECAGGLTNSTEDFCPEGRQGYLCARCTDEFYKSEQQCEECGNAIGAITPILLVCTIVLCVVVYLGAGSINGRTMGVGASISILFAHSQVLSAVSRYSTDIPAQVLALVKVFQIFSININVLQLECVIPAFQGYVGGYYSLLLVPFFLAFCMVLTFFASHLVYRLSQIPSVAAFNKKMVEKYGGETAATSAAASSKSDEKVAIADSAVVTAKKYLVNTFFDPRPMNVWRAIGAWIVLCELLFLQFASGILSAFDCYEQPADGSLSLASEPSVECYSDEWTALVFPMVVGLLLVAALPVTYAVALYRYRGHYATGRTRSVALKKTSSVAAFANLNRAGTDSASSSDADDVERQAVRDARKGDKPLKSALKTPSSPGTRTGSTPGTPLSRSTSSWMVKLETDGKVDEKEDATQLREWLLFSPMWMRYAPKQFAWHMVVLLRKFLISFAITAANASAAIKLGLATVVLACAAVVQALYSPYLHKRNNRLELMVLIIDTVVVGVLFTSVVDSANDTVSDDGLYFILIALVIASAVFALLELFLAIWKAQKHGINSLSHQHRIINRSLAKELRVAFKGGAQIVFEEEALDVEMQAESSSDASSYHESDDSIIASSLTSDSE